MTAPGGPSLPVRVPPRWTSAPSLRLIAAVAAPRSARGSTRGARGARGARDSESDGAGPPPPGEAPLRLGEDLALPGGEHLPDEQPEGLLDRGPGLGRHLHVAELLLVRSLEPVHG